MYTKKSQFDRQAFLDRLEKKYIEKVQLHTFKQESERLKQTLRSIQGKKVNALKQDDFEMLDDSEYKLVFS